MVSPPNSWNSCAARQKRSPNCIASLRSLEIRYLPRIKVCLVILKYASVVLACLLPWGHDVAEASSSGTSIDPSEVRPPRSVYPSS